MATVTTPPAAHDREESRRKVGHPLQRLRGYIRCYVTAEGLAVLLIYLALWFWIGLLLDYGLFKVFALDWVQELPHRFRIVLLCVLTIGLLAVVTVKVLVRLFREFRDVALALVLERRFPKVLGDRLITAIEMADPRLAAQYDYSQAMVDQTVYEAAERVEKCPVHEVFDWKRLRRYGAVVALLTAGIYLLAGAGYCAWRRAPLVDQYVSDFNDVAMIWFERNVLLIDTIWPRRAHLELVGFPGDELKLGRDAPAPTLRVRALKWVIADQDRQRAPEGWRALLWQDLQAHPHLAGVNHVPELPAELQPPGWRGTVDEVELQLDRQRQSLIAHDFLPILDKLDERAASPRMKRRLRKLAIPTEVEVTLRGDNTRSTQNLQSQGGNEYAGTLSDLKESVKFRVRGEDYYTPYKKITVVPPPDLAELILDEDQPAYLYHRVPVGGGPNALRGLRQEFRGRHLSLTGDKSSVEVPAGTNLVLTAKADKPLQLPGGVRVVPPQGAPEIKVDVEQPDGQTFRTRFDNVTVPIDLTFEFTDTDGVSGQRHVVIKPTPDVPPDVNVQIEVLRKTSQGYMCTYTALVPFSGTVHDDHGLADVEYVYSVTQVGSALKVAQRAARLFGSLPGGLSPTLGALAPWYEKALAKRLRLVTFDPVLRDRVLESYEPAQLRKALKEPLPEAPIIDRRLIKEFNLDALNERFDVAKLELQVKNERAAQPKYLIQIGVVATDNNIETGPSTNQKKEKFTLVVVSEEELLGEIGKEEENLHYKLQETIERLKEAQVKLDQAATDLKELKPGEDGFSPLVRRTEEIGESIAKGSDITREIWTDYSRILKELEVNQDREQSGGLISKMITKVGDRIVTPLAGALDNDFVNADKSIRDFREALEAKNVDPKLVTKARGDLTRLITRLEGVLSEMADVTKLSELIKALAKIKTLEDAERDRLDEIRKKIEDQIFEGIDAGTSKEDKKDK